MATAGPLGGVNAETVQILRTAVQGILSAEHDRASSLMTRGSGLAGFVGLALPLSVVLAGWAPAHGWRRETTIALALAAAVALLAAVLLTLLEVLLPSPGITIALEEVRRYPTYEFIRQEPLMVEGRLLRGDIETLAVERRRNDRKGRSLRYAYIALTAGLVLVAVEGILLVVTRA
jgi:hypothetical protein